MNKQEIKSELVKKAEQEAREACEGLNYTEEQLKDFIEWHVGNEIERDAQKAKDLERPKRSSDLTKAIISITVDLFRESFPSYSTKQSMYKTDEQIMAANYARKRNKGET